MKKTTSRLDPANVPMFAGLSKDERDDAIENLTRYMRVVIQIADRLDRDSSLRSRYHALTGKRWTGRVKGDRGSSVGLS